MSNAPDKLTPVTLTIHFTDPEADPSVFAKCLVRYEGAWMLVTDQTKSAPRVAHAFPAHGISSVTAEEWVGR